MFSHNFIFLYILSYLTNQDTANSTPSFSTFHYLSHHTENCYLALLTGNKKLPAMLCVAMDDSPPPR